MTSCCQIKSWLIPIALLLGAGTLAFSASSFAHATPAQDPPPPEKPKEKPTEKPGEKPHEGGRGGFGRGGQDGGGLEGAMNSMKAAAKRLDKEIAGKDPNAWKSVAQFERGVVNAKLEEPPMVKDLSEAERPAALLSYRSMLADLLTSSCELEHQVLAGKWDDATKTWNEKVKPAQKMGHDKFKKD